MNERDITAADVERQHLAEIHPRRAWLYLFAVPVVGFVAMLALLQLFDSLT
jgi:hypothetical protein